MDTARAQVEKGFRSVAHAVKYGASAPNVTAAAEENVDALMRHLYVVPLAKGHALTGHNLNAFDALDEEDEAEEEDDNASDNEEDASMQQGYSFVQQARDKSLGTRPDARVVESDEEMDDDADGFGVSTEAISRMSGEDTALARFLRRAMASNADAAQISDAEDADGSTGPRSETEILATLNPKYYEEAFDAAWYMLEAFPKEIGDFNAYIEKQLSENDVAKEYIIARLASGVEANYHVLVDGMNIVQDVDIDLTAASVQIVNSRRKLAVASKCMRDPIVQVLHKRLRLENLRRLVAVMQGAYTVLLLEKQSADAGSKGELEEAVVSATRAKLAADHELLRSVDIMDSIRYKLDQTLPSLRLDVDRSLRRMCAQGFSSGQYATVIRAYMTLDDHGVRLEGQFRRGEQDNEVPQPNEMVEDTLAQGMYPVHPNVDRGGIPDLISCLQRFFLLEIDYVIRAALVKIITMPLTCAKSGGPETRSRTIAMTKDITQVESAALLKAASPATFEANLSSRASELTLDVNGRCVSFRNKKLAHWGVLDLARQLPPGSSLAAIVKIAEYISQIMHSHFKIAQWHRSPFDERNEDLNFLHREYTRRQDSAELSDLEDQEDEDSPGRRNGNTPTAAGQAEDESDGSADEDDEVDTGFDDRSTDDRKAAAAKQRQVNESKRTRLTQARLAAIAQELRHASKQLWLPVEKAIAAVLKAEKENNEEVSLDTTVDFVVVIELLLLLREESGSSSNSGLVDTLHDKMLASLDRMRQEAVAAIKQMLERETWYHVPVPVEGLGGLTGILRSHLGLLAWPALNGWGQMVKERVCRHSSSQSSTTSPNFQASTSAYFSMLEFGNPFSLLLAAGNNQASSRLKTQEDLLILDRQPCSNPIATHQLMSRPSHSAITQLVLNGILKHSARYIALISIAPCIALDGLAHIGELLDLYVYAVFHTFVPEPSAQLLLNTTKRLNTESTIAEEMMLADHDTYIPLPCEDQDFRRLREYLIRVREELIDTDYWNLSFPVQMAMPSAETAHKIKKTAADTAKGFGKALVSGASTMGALAVTGATSVGNFRSDVPPSSTSGTTSSTCAAPRPVLPVSTSAPPVSAASLQAAPTTASTRHNASLAADKPNRSRKVKLQIPSPLAEVLDSEANLYASSQRTVATESCFFLVEVLAAAQPKLLGLIPYGRSTSSNRRYCAGCTEQVEEILPVLRSFVYRSVAPRLIGASQIIREVLRQEWNQCKIREEANSYTDDLCSRATELWRKICGLPGGVPIISGLDDTYFPPPSQLVLWSEIVQAAMAAMLEGFARVDRCSTEGRSLMSMDLQAVQLGLDAAQLARPLRGKAYVDLYVKAYYFGEEDVMSWITQNYKTYFFRHIGGLLTAIPGIKKKKQGLRILISQAAQLYAS